jgi:hypothetical protein
MPKKKTAAPRKTAKTSKRPIEQYEHPDKQRANKPQWAGKAEHTSFEVPTVSSHVHERIDPKTTLQAVREQNGAPPEASQLSLFAKRTEIPPLREALDFYRHPRGWSNRLVAGAWE